jgi:hypothetical protein
MRNFRQSFPRCSRSNQYSQSKLSNWAEFDPYRGEVSQIQYGHKPTTILEFDEDVKIKIYVRPLHEDFIRPYGIDDIEKTLRTVPVKFLRGLDRILLLGGTKKQNQVAWGKLFRYGFYNSCQWIALTAYPKKMMQMIYDGPIRPHHQHEFQKTFTKTYQEGDDWIVQFDEESLKMFYLQDTLIHEIGHHVDWRRRNHWNDVTEEFAEWFAQAYGFNQHEMR